MLLKDKLSDTKAESYPLICSLILVIMMIFSVIFTYSSVITKVNVMKSNTEIVFDSFVANNSIKIYSNIKQGNNAMKGIDEASFNKTLKQFCTLDEYNGVLYNKNGKGEEQYNISIPRIEYIDGENLELKVSYTMNIPIFFAGAKVTTAHIPVTITSALNSKN